MTDSPDEALAENPQVEIRDVPKRPKIAWSDDLSYDSEEEREKQRLIQAELDARETPIKPEYTEEELATLVKYIKRITTLYDLRESDWNECCESVINEWLLSPKEPLLSIFFNGLTLSAAMTIPMEPVYDLTYFLRDPEMIFTVANFHDEVHFGTFVESADGTLLKVMEYVYAPYFFAINTWPDSVKSEFCGQLHSFLAKLTDMHYKMLGLTVVYAPREGRKLPTEEAAADRELVRRLEGVVVYWTHQMKSCIEDHTSLASQRQLLCPSDEYEFWVYRYENLSGLYHQIQNPSVKHIRDILITTHSTFIGQFQTLCDEIAQAMTEAKSNIEYLQVIKQPCAVLECITDPDHIPGHISNILNLFRFIWKESPYYNSEERLSNLFKCLSNQVIILCSNHIELDSLFAGQTRKALGEFSKCIDCCKRYREIYDLVAEAHNDREPGSWQLDTSFIFNYIDSFVQRCHDMLDVCNAMIIFGRIDELETVAKPIFSGTQGEQFEKVTEMIESMFTDALIHIKSVKHNILDVQTPSWYNDILKFRAVTKDIEIIVENLVDSVFGTVNHVEEAIVALFSMHNYSKRKNLKRLFKRKTVLVWDMFCEEIQSIKKDMVSEKNQFPSEMPSYAGKAAMYFMRRSRLLYLKKVVTDAAWMMTCSNSEEVMLRANQLISAIGITIRDLWLAWTYTLDEKCATGLNRTLMYRNPTNPILLECNIDKNILELCKESLHWENLEMDTPSVAFQVYRNAHTVLFVHESVLAVVKGYNRILDSLSAEERLLFKPLIMACERKIQPGITKLTWTSSMSDAYIADCVAQIGELQEFLDTYKTCNVNIVKLCEKVCDTPLIEFGVYNAFTLVELKNLIRHMDTAAILKILEMYKEIVTYLIIVYEGFENSITSMAVHWVNYVKRFDLLFEDALRLALKSTMQNMYKSIHGDGTMAPSPLIRMKLILTEDISHVPTADQIKLSFAEILDDIIEMLKTIPRLHQKFGLPLGDMKTFSDVIAADPDCKRLQNLINQEVEQNLKQVEEHIQQWDPYKHIWTIQKEEFLKRYCEEKHTANDFDQLISNYNDLANAVQVQETITQLHFITLGSVSLKTSVINHCIVWQTKLSELLRNMTELDIDNVYKYVEHSSEVAMKEPLNLIEMQQAIVTYDRLLTEVPQMESTFPAVKEQMITLGTEES